MSFRRKHRNPDNRPLLSVCSILILSGFLLGLGLSEKIDGMMQVYVFSAGFLGILSFVGLDHVRTRRREQAESVEQMLVEQRLERHVGSCASMSDLRRDQADTDEYDALTDLTDELSRSSAALPVAG